MLVTVGELRAVEAHIYVPSRGAWWMDLDFDSDAPLTGRATIHLEGLAGSQDWVGTVDESQSGTWGLRRHVRIVGGAGAWGSPLPPKAYHNDAGVRVSRVVRDAAAELGETAGTLTTTVRGPDYVREAGPASVVFEDDNWWVDSQGITNVGPRPAAPAPPTGLSALEFDARTRMVTLPCDGPNTIAIGMILTDRLDNPQVVTSYEIHITAESARIVAWCGAGVGSKVIDNLARLVRAFMADKLWGSWTYIVGNMVGDRVRLIATAPGMPDLDAIEEWTGPGIHALLTPGSEVLVTFANGERGRPRIIGFSPHGAGGAVPQELRLGDATSPVARVGDTVQVFFPPLVIGTATIAGTPTPIVLDMAGLTSFGQIQSGNSKVKA